MPAFDETLLGAGKNIKRGYNFIYENSGKLIAAITAVIAIVLTFTEVAMPSIVTAEMTSEIAVLLIASVIIYLSLEDAGERLGKDGDSFRLAYSEYDTLRQKARKMPIDEVREFCLLYSDEELRYRRRTAMFEYGITEDEYKRFLSGETLDKKRQRYARKISRMKPLKLDPRSLFGDGDTRGSSEIKNPERRKWLRLLIGITPSLLCMLFTVSVMISAKDGMSPSEIIEGIVKLSALPVIGIKGYSSGYSWATGPLTLWQKTKSSLITAFLSGKYRSSAEAEASA